MLRRFVRLVNISLDRIVRRQALEREGRATQDDGKRVVVSVGITCRHVSYRGCPFASMKGFFRSRRRRGDKVAVRNFAGEDEQKVLTLETNRASMHFDGRLMSFSADLEAKALGRRIDGHSEIGQRE